MVKAKTRLASPASPPDQRRETDEADARVVTQRHDLVQRLGLALVDEEEEAFAFKGVAGDLELLLPVDDAPPAARLGLADVRAVERSLFVARRHQPPERHGRVRAAVMVLHLLVHPAADQLPDGDRLVEDVE